MNPLSHVTDHADLAQQMKNNGYCVLKQAVKASSLHRAESEFHQLSRNADNLLTAVQDSRLSLGDYYRSGAARFIVVPEADNPQQTCRFEYIRENAPVFRNEIIPLCQHWIELLIAQSVTLFKDKCNLKSPGGGAFTPHQDIEAYLPFGPQFHITAALLLDPATKQNGALEFADNYTHVQHPKNRYLTTPIGDLPVFATQNGGPDHGRLLPELENELQWSPVYTEPGDLLLFNSFVPHRSAINLSDSTRRAFFFTFNLTTEGDHYETYYKQKREDFSSPHFHVATPTLRN